MRWVVAAGDIEANAGACEVHVGGGITAKLLLLVPVNPLTVTAILPVVAPLGVVITSWVVVAELTAAVMPFRVTELFATVAPKPLPTIVTVVPVGPLVGVKLVIVGVAAHATTPSGMKKITHRNDIRYLKRACTRYSGAEGSTENAIPGFVIGVLASGNGRSHENLKLFGRVAG